MKVKVKFLTRTIHTNCVFEEGQIYDIDKELYENLKNVVRVEVVSSVNNEEKLEEMIKEKGKRKNKEDA